MIQRKGIFIITIAVPVILGVVWWFLRSSPTPMAQAGPSPSPVAQAGPTGTPFPASPTPRPLLVDNVTGKTMSQEEALQNYVDRFSKDPVWEGKVPLSFYGKVVDENNQPVAGASVHLQWNTTRELGGTAYAETSSDGNGLFSLTHQHGKILGVRVEKDGYYTVEGGGAEVSFEYANPSSPYWYEPDINNPVVFHLRKKGMNAAHLLHWQRNVALNAQNQKALDFKTGQTTQGQLPSLFIEVLENNGKPGSLAWSARVSVVGGGGLQLETDQFPFLAPTSGYQPSIEVNLTTPQPPGRNGIAGGAFYVQTPEGYGYYAIGMSPGTHWIAVQGYFNPTPGDRNLEPASN